MSNKGLLKSLADLDLPRYEGEVFLALLELGPSNAGPIIKRTGLHRQFVYSALERLQEKGLTSHVVREGRRVFEAAPPQELVQAQRRRERLAVELIPQLEALSSRSSDRLSVFTRRGVKEFRENLITVLEQAAAGDGVVRVIGGASGERFYEVLGDFYKAYVSAGRRLKVRKHLLAPEQLSAPFKQTFTQEDGTELRLSKHLSAPTYTRITPELVTMEVYSSDPMIIQIWNRSIAQSYREHFEILWQRAEPFLRRAKP